MKFWQSSIWSFLSVALRSVAGLLINKYFAVQFGAVGVSLFAHFQNLLNLLYLPVNEGVHKGLIKAWNDTNVSAWQKRRYFWAGLAINGSLLAVSGGALWLGRAFFITEFGITSGYAGWAALVVLGLSAQILHFLGISYLLSQDRIPAYAFFNVLGGISAIAVLWFWNASTLATALLAYHVGSASVGVLTTLYVGRLWWRRAWLRPVFSLNQNDFTLPLSFVLMAGSVSVFEKGGQFLIRSWAMETFTEQVVGEWQAVVKLSDSYALVFASTFVVIFFPKLSTLIHHPEERRRYLREVFGLITPLLLLLLGAVFLLREHLLRLLFSEEFVPAARWVWYVVIGDFFRLQQYFLSQLLLAAGEMRRYIILQIVFNTVYLSAAFSAVYAGDPEGLLQALMGSYVLAALVLFWVVRRWW